MQQIKVQKRMTNYILLVLVIVLSILISSLLTNIYNKKIHINIFGNEIEHFENNDIIKEEKIYISLDLIKKYIDSDTFYDRVSKKVIITSEKNIVKAKINEKVYTKNFEKNELENAILLRNDKIYFQINTLKDLYDLDVAIDGNNIYMLHEDKLKCDLIGDNTSLHKSKTSKSKVIKRISKKDNIKILIQKELDIYSNNNMRSNIFIKVLVNDTYVGYIPRYLVKINEDELAVLEDKRDNIDNKETAKNNKTLAIFTENDDSTMLDSIKNSVNTIYINKFDIIQSDGSIEEMGVSQKWLEKAENYGYEVYGILTNGFNSVNFDKNTISTLMASETNREILIKNICQELKKYNLDGVMIDFRNIKESDTENFIQFIKELSSFIGQMDKKVVLNIYANDYEKYIGGVIYSNYSVINVYDVRNIKSSVSGSVGEVTWAKNVIGDIILKYENIEQKLVLGIPAYSIVWTEKNGMVVEAKNYGMSAIEDYLQKNGTKTVFNEKMGQNYSEITKGNLVYRMWLEDEVSVRGRLDIVNNNEMAGVAVYKKGYDNEKMWKWIEKSLNK